MHQLPTNVLRLLLISAGTITALSCGDDQGTGPTDGTIRVEARTTGSDFDVDGYLVSVNSGMGEEIGNLDVIHVTALEPGEYVVSLGGIATNCSVPSDDNPQDATVLAGDTVDVLFDITCEPPDGGGGPPPFLRSR